MAAVVLRGHSTHDVLDAAWRLICSWPWLRQNWRVEMFGSKKKDAAFFDAFSEHADKSVAAAKLFLEMLRRMDTLEAPYAAPALGAAQAIGSETQQLGSRIKELERAGDIITHQTVKRLHENWITPLDRNDIHALMSCMDDVLDFIEAAAERIVLFQVCVASPEASKLAALLVRACETLARAIALLRTMARSKEILELCVEMSRLEHAADDVYRKALAELFRAGNDPLTVMKWRDIFDSLECAVDRCEDVANILEGVVLEYA